LGDEPDDLNPIRVDLKMFVAMAAHESLDLAVGMVRAVRALNRDVAKELAVVVYDAVEDAVGPAPIRAMRAENDPEPTPRSSEVTAGQNVRENQDVIGKPALGRKKPNVLAREIAALERLEKSGDLVEFSDLYAVSSKADIGLSKPQLTASLTDLVEKGWIVSGGKGLYGWRDPHSDVYLTAARTKRRKLAKS
jgi:hypothetical protein